MPECLGCGKEVNTIVHPTMEKDGTTTYLCEVCGTYSEIPKAKSMSKILINTKYNRFGNKIIVECKCKKCNNSKREEFSLGKLIFKH